jgi:hypothetical protein
MPRSGLGQDCSLLSIYAGRGSPGELYVYAIARWGRGKTVHRRKSRRRRSGHEEAFCGVTGHIQGSWEGQKSQVPWPWSRNLRACGVRSRKRHPPTPTAVPVI